MLSWIRDVPSLGAVARELQRDAMDNFIDMQIKKIRETVGDKRVLLGLSGGVDSSVVGVLLQKAIGDQLICIFVDHGLLRKGEADQVMDMLGGKFGLNIVKADAAKRFLDKLAGVSDPEQKRKIIGNEFVYVFDDEASKLKDVKFLVEQIEFMLEGEVEAHEILADYINEPYEEIVKEKVWPPSGDHYIKHMYYHAYTHENAAYTIAAMAPCPYVYEVIAKWGLEDSNLNRDALTAKWFDFYSTEMAPLIEVFDRLLNELTEHCTEQEKREIKEAFLQSTVHERHFFNMAYIDEEWDFGGANHE